MTTTPKLTSYHFNCGNSNTGPVGFCARVVAETREQALAILRQALEVQEFAMTEHVRDRLADDNERGQYALEYLHVYFNGANVTVADSDPENDEPEQDDPEGDYADS